MTRSSPSIPSEAGRATDQLVSGVVSPCEEATPHSSKPSAILQLRAICVALALLGVFGMGLAEIIDAYAIGTSTHPSSDNVFYYLYSTYDRLGNLLLIVTGVAFFLWLEKLSSATSDIQLPRFVKRQVIWFTAMAVFVVTLAGTFFICMNHPLSMDEFFSDFQAKIFARGHFFAHINEPWTALAPAMTPVMTLYDPAQHTWTSTYLPVYAAIRAPFVTLGLQCLVNPLLALGSIFAAAAATRAIWPHDRSLPAVSAVLLASSSQFLITGMTAYAMTAHICLNLTWLALYSRGGRIELAIAPWIGLLAMGLHQPNVHGLFVAPFLVRMLFSKRWKLLAYFATVYAFSCAVWFAYLQFRAPHSATGAAVSAAQTSSTLLGMFMLPGPLQILNHSIGLTQVFAWQPFALGILSLLALFRLRRLPPVLFDLATGAALALAFYSLYPAGQGHGWGNRYFFPYLGNLLILAVAGWRELCIEAGEPRARAFLSASMIITLLIQLPIYCYCVRDFTKPFADASRYLQSLPEDSVVIATQEIWYGQDLVRNEPFLENRPRIFFMNRLRKENAEVLQKRGTVRLVRYKDLAQFGLTPRLSGKAE